MLTWDEWGNVEHRCVFPAWLLLFLVVVVIVSGGLHRAALLLPVHLHLLLGLRKTI